MVFYQVLYNTFLKVTVIHGNISVNAKNSITQKNAKNAKNSGFTMRRKLKRAFQCPQNYLVVLQNPPKILGSNTGKHIKNKIFDTTGEG